MEKFLHGDSNQLMEFKIDNDLTELNLEREKEFPPPGIEP